MKSLDPVCNGLEQPQVVSTLFRCNQYDRLGLMEGDLCSVTDGSNGSLQGSICPHTKAISLAPHAEWRKGW